MTDRRGLVSFCAQSILCLHRQYSTALRFVAPNTNLVVVGVLTHPDTLAVYVTYGKFLNCVGGVSMRPLPMLSFLRKLNLHMVNRTHSHKLNMPLSHN